MNKLIVSVVTCLAIQSTFAYFDDFKKPIRLARVAVEDDGYGLTKYYNQIMPLEAHYDYSRNITDGDWLNKLHLSFDGNIEGVLIPVDVVKVGFTVGGDGDDTTRKFKIPDIDLSEGCSLTGVATVILDDMWIWSPEYPSSYDSGAKVVRVVSSSKPKLECDLSH